MSNSIEHIEQQHKIDEQQHKIIELERAFIEFAKMSEDLEGSYYSLQDQVSNLTEELGAARNERSRLLAVLPGGVVVLDDKGVVQTVNPAAQNFFSENPDEELESLEGRNWSDILKQYQDIEERVSESLANDLVLKSGKILELSSSETDAGMILLFSDVTETRKLQHHTNQNRRLASMGEMAASLAHQVRTPLAAALLYIAHLEKEELTEDKRLQVAEKLRSRLHHLNGLVNDMLHYARGGSPDDEEIELSGFMENLEQIVEEEIKRSPETHFSIEVLADPQTVFGGNRDALLTSLQNLVSNAIDAADGKVNILVRVVTPTEGGIEFQVKDDGPGISVDMQEHIFEPFYTSRARGTGLGLAVVQAVADAHGGDVWVESSLGDGANFGVRLPNQSE
ncbi:MAG: PAS domain-containing sensor histidine kinase [Thiotrichales bacterium]|jgi:two-component system sensor histidine kinase FlrB|nr:PAS domain-containing sensor histidine kinase [Thiotrichales bacterium]MBT4261983.1 PAS domain-containing sensor histidine kinase [Thiotrichales bacterium]MBT4972437.1 PAS domain-containing sensor histidine kinase [Thiotrichales bacterium]MBT5290842.1 PAS domain-containing sensor histidine kinase [Thiotrichales bacterium]MBT5418234.1 PAS domain-containing sensor histidine kinase [Thiotrichales bacterium]